jgi:hypothetical protein
MRGRTAATRLLGALLLPACPAQEVSVGAWSPAPASPEPPQSDAMAETQDDAGSEPSFPYIEAESGELSGGFLVGASTEASSGAFLAAPLGESSDEQPGPARAVYRLLVPRSADYLIWGRIHAPGAANNRFWFQVDDGPMRKWRISAGDIWYWDAFHDDFDYGNALVFPLEAGEHTLTLASCVEGVALDRLYLTADGDVPPGNDTPCSPPHSIELAGACLPSCGAQRGRMCGEAACAGRPLLDAYDCDVCCEGL